MTHQAGTPSATSALAEAREASPQDRASGMSFADETRAAEGIDPVWVFQPPRQDSATTQNMEALETGQQEQRKSKACALM